MAPEAGEELASRAGPRAEALLEERRRPADWAAWLETLALAAFAPLLGLAVQPRDPFFLHGFSWLSLAPVLAGLRYGFARGLGCAVALIAGIGLASRLGLPGASGLPPQLAVGLLALGMAAGEFRDLWTRRLEQACLGEHDARMQLGEFSRVYHLLRVSHEKLEQRLVGAPSLREMLANLRDAILASDPDHGPLLGLARPLLELFLSHGGVRAACVFEVERDGGVKGALAGQLGTLPPPRPEEPLLAAAVARGKAVSLRDLGARERGTCLLAAIPLVDVRGRIWAVVAIQDMQFSAFHEANLEMLAILGGHVGDLLASRLLSAVDPAGEHFVLQLRRALETRKTHAVPAAVLALHLGSGRGGALVEPLRTQRRGLDAQWLHAGRDGAPVMLVLMPLSDEDSVEGFIARLDRLAREHLGAGLDALGIRVRSRMLDEDDTAESVLAALSGTERRDDVEALDCRSGAAGAPELGSHG